MRRVCGMLMLSIKTAGKICYIDTEDTQLQILLCCPHAVQSPAAWTLSIRRALRGLNMVYSGPCVNVATFRRRRSQVLVPKQGGRRRGGQEGQSQHHFHFTFTQIWLLQRTKWHVHLTELKHFSFGQRAGKAI